MESSVIFFPCEDIKKTVAFYTDVCGLRVSSTQAGGVTVILDSGYGYIGFCQYGDGRPMPVKELSPCISFNCRDCAEVDSVYLRVAAAGAEILQKPARHSRFPVYSFFISDPNGYKVEFQKILEEN